MTPVVATNFFVFSVSIDDDVSSEKEFSHGFGYLKSRQD
jgi:hypothetical protein